MYLPSLLACLCSCLCLRQQLTVTFINHLKMFLICRQYADMLIKKLLFLLVKAEQMSLRMEKDAAFMIKFQAFTCHFFLYFN